MRTNWQSSPGEQSSYRRGACQSRNKYLKVRVVMASHRNQTPSRSYLLLNCIGRRVQCPLLSTAGHIPSKITCTILPGKLTLATRTSSHRSYLNGDHRDDPTTHTHHSTSSLRHWHLRLSHSQLLSIRYTNNPLWRHTTHGPSNPQVSPANSTQPPIPRSTGPNLIVTKVTIHTPTNHRLHQHTSHGRSRHRHPNPILHSQRQHPRS